MNHGETLLVECIYPAISDFVAKPLLLHPVLRRQSGSVKLINSTVKYMTLSCIYDTIEYIN